MGKGFKKKLCVYCATEESTSADHVFARQFFLPQHRRKLPKVPACDGCNREKSNLEHYLASLLPFGGRHAVAAENLGMMVPRRLQKNARLSRELLQGQGRAWTQEGSLVVPTMTLPIDSRRFEKLFEFVVRGLVWYHWGIYLTSEHFVQVWTLTKAGEELFDERLFSLNAHSRVNENLGHGTFIYQGAQGVDCAQVTVWHIWVYGGVHLSEDANGVAATASRINVVTGPQSARRAADLAFSSAGRHKSLATGERSQKVGDPALN